MKSYTIHGLLFDMDGVLIDSNAEIERFWKEWAAKSNKELSMHDITKHIHGRTTIETLRVLFGHLDEKGRLQILDAATAFDLNMRPSLINGASAFLQALRQFTQHIGLVTSAPIPRAKLLLENLGIFSIFKYTVTGDEVNKGKPDPEPYLLGSHKMHIAPHDCLVFEDSNSGIQSAIHAGMYVIAVNNTMQHEHIIANIKDYTDLTCRNGTINIPEKNIEIRITKS